MQDIFVTQFNSRIHVMENYMPINPSLVMNYVDLNIKDYS